jgi:hypothetical protein
MRAQLHVMLLVAAWAGALWAATNPSAPRLIQARQKAEAPRSFETRTLADLGGWAGAPPAPLDVYGGWDQERRGATGFFRVEKIGPRWWLIDPRGARFLHLAVNGVRPGGSPRPQAALVERFGSLPAWRQQTAALLRAWGFNGVGAWSDDRFAAGDEPRLVYTPMLNFMSGFGRERGGLTQEPGHLGYPNRCIFVFDPAFEAFADRHAQRLAARKDDPYLLGYFTDNELPFPRDSLDRHLALADDDPGHLAAAAWWKERGGKTPSDADRADWLEFVVDRYLGIVCRAIRKHDPNHLVLGSRLYGPDLRSAAVWRAAGRHLDVVAVNVYGVWTPTAGQVGGWADWSGRPVLVSEWYAKGDDAGLANTSGAGWTVATQRERGCFYQNFALGLLESRACVGWHWFRYLDNDPEDRAADPSNRDANKGIVNLRYEPYAPLVEAMAELNRAAYPLTEYFDRDP